MLFCDCFPGRRENEDGKGRSNRGSTVHRARDGGMVLAFAGNGTTETGGCGVGGAVNDGAVESESFGDIVRGLGGGESSEGLSTLHGSGCAADPSEGGRDGGWNFACSRLETT